MKNLGRMPKITILSHEELGKCKHTPKINLNIVWWLSMIGSGAECAKQAYVGLPRGRCHCCQLLGENSDFQPVCHECAIGVLGASVGAFELPTSSMVCLISGKKYNNRLCAWKFQHLVCVP